MKIMCPYNLKKKNNHTYIIKTDKKTVEENKAHELNNIISQTPAEIKRLHYNEIGRQVRSEAET